MRSLMSQEYVSVTELSGKVKVLANVGSVLPVLVSQLLCPGRFLMHLELP
jgi:hypothetical protein